MAQIKAVRVHPIKPRENFFASFPSPLFDAREFPSFSHYVFSVVLPPFPYSRSNDPIEYQAFGSLKKIHFFFCYSKCCYLRIDVINHQKFERAYTFSKSTFLLRLCMEAMNLFLIVCMSRWIGKKEELQGAHLSSWRGAVDEYEKTMGDRPATRTSVLFPFQRG